MVQCIRKRAKVTVVSNREKPESFPNNNRKVICRQSGRFQSGTDAECCVQQRKNSISVHLTD